MNATRHRPSLALAAALVLAVAPLAATEPRTVPEFTTFMDLAHSPLGDMAKMDAWRSKVPDIREVSIPSSADGEAQPALFYDSGSDRAKPLLVVLHSWTADYRQQFSVPYGVWAARNDWVLIHPDYRGRFNRPQATLSELAVSDVLDAVRWAREQARVDPDRIYLAGFSGGGSAVLTMVGRHPELWTAAVAWVPVYDLVEWWSTIREHHDLHYAGDIVASCRGEPRPGTAAEKACRERSPSSYLPDARGHDVRVLIATGVEDWFVPPAHALDAFNALADPSDRLAPKVVDAISDRGRVPRRLRRDARHPLFEAAGKKLLLERSSSQAVLWVFSGSHDVVYNAGLAWLAEQGPDR